MMFFKFIIQQEGGDAARPDSVGAYLKSRMGP